MKYLFSRNLFILLVLFLLVFIFSCSNSGVDIETIAWEEDGSGYVQFSTNDLNNYFFGFLNPYVTTFQNSYSNTTFSLIRKSGSELAGYGGIFCYQDDDNHYIIFISGVGKYQIVKNIGGNYTVLTDPAWIVSDDLIQGYDQINEIAITRNNSTDQFTIIFNGGLDNITFTDTDLTSGSSGFYTYIADNSTGELFPYEANDVRFKITGPVVIP